MSRIDRIRAAAAFAVVAVLSTPAVAVAQGAPQADADWPCVQRKVPTLTPAAIWTGPSLEQAGEWTDDAEVADLVRRLSQRRTPLEEAQAEIEAFAETLDPSAREERLTLLFAGLFDTMNAERGDIIDGIERYARRQRAMAEDIRAEAQRIDAAGEGGSTVEAREKLRWEQRIFDERRKSLPYICEAPRLVEQRLFALGRTIGKAMAN